MDTTSPAGRMMMQIVATFAEFARAMLRERTRNGLDAARSQGRIGGRRPKLKPHQQEEIVNLVNSGQKTAADAARLFSVHLATMSRLLQRNKIGFSKYPGPGCINVRLCNQDWKRVGSNYQKYAFGRLVAVVVCVRWLSHDLQREDKR